MKKTQIIELIQTIKKTIVSFVSITIFVMLGVCVFLGFDWTATSFKYKLNNHYDSDNYHDLEIYYPYGVNKEDLEKLKDVPGVDEIECSYFCYEFFKKGNESGLGKIVSITNELDLCFDLKGRLPENENEILIDEGSAYLQGLEIGDKVTFYGKEAEEDYVLNTICNYQDLDLDQFININKNNHSYLKSKEVEIVGTIKNPEYISMSKAAYGISTRSGIQVNAIFYTNYDSFDKDVVNNYNQVLIRNNDLRNKYTFSDEYLKLSEEFVENIKDTANQIGKDNYQNVKNKANNIIADASKALDDANAKLLKAQSDINDATNEWTQNSKTLNSYRKSIDEAKKLLDENEIKLNDAMQEIAEGESQLASAIHQYNEQSQKIEKYRTTYNKIKSASQRLHTYFINGLDDVQASLYLAEELGFDVKTIINRENINTIIDFLKDETIKEYIGIIEEFENNKDEVVELMTDFIIEYVEKYYGEIDPQTINDNVQYIYDKVISIKARLQALDDTRISYLDALIELSEYDDVLFNETVEGYQSIVDYVIEMLSQNILDNIELIKEYFGDGGLYTILINSVDVYISEAFNNADIELRDAYEKIEDGRNLLSSYKNEYNEALDEFNAKKQEYLDATIELENGKNALAKAKQTIDDSQKELDEHIKEYENNKDKYNEFVGVIDQVKDYGTVVQTRNVNPGYIYVELLSDIVSKLKTNLGGLFLIISLFICYSVITRNVHVQVKQIGTKKSLGLSQKEITLSFVLYAAITVVIGGSIGIVLAYCVVEELLVPILSQSFTFARHAEYFNIKDVLLLVGLEFILIEGVTLFACKKVLKTQTIELLKGIQSTNEKERFYEKFSIWNKTSLFLKTIINNAFNDSQRVFATIFGIMGCTTLVVSSIMLRNNVLNSFDKQYDRYFLFDTMICYDSTDLASDEIGKILKENNIEYSDVYYSIGYAYNDKFDKLLVKEFIYEDIDSFSKLVKFDTHDGQDFNYNGAWLSESVKIYYNLENQESIIFNESTGNKANINLNGFYKYYYYKPILFMDAVTYEKCFDSKQPHNNVFIINSKDIDLYKLNSQLESVDGYLSTFEYYDYCKNEVEVFKTIATAIVSIYLIISVLMSIFVLLNLIKTFVMEKKNELIVLMINGFSRKDAKKYIYLDTIVMTIIGTVLGVIVGYLAGVAGIGSFESKYMYLLHNLDFFACAIGILLSISLTFIMASIAIKKIDNYKLTDINKNS